MKSLIISLSGVRGIIGKDLTPDVLSRLAGSFGTILPKGKVVVATDTRISREMCQRAVVSGLISTGCEVINLGICPTPALQTMIPKLKAQGGICITASHNPPDWNGLKFYTGEGILLGPARAKRLISIFDKSKVNYVPSRKLGTVKEEKRACSIYKNAVLRLLNAKLIRKKRFKVVIDCADGAGSVVAPAFLKELGCQVTRLNCGLSGTFNRPPEPIPQNLAGLRSLVRRKKAEIGFAQDPDADRLAVVSNEGKCLGEDYSLVLATQLILSHSPGVVVTNLSTTLALDKVAEKFGCPVIRSKVGERNVVEMMKKKGAVIGGEGNGGIILPSLHYGRDSLAGMGLILQHMAETGRSISELADSLPRFHIIKRKIPLKKMSAMKAIHRIRSHFKDAKFDLRDGVKAMWDESWVHVRPSGTEPVLRIVAEARTKSEAMRIYRQAAAVVEHRSPCHSERSEESKV
jgi:phosphomannomutase